MFPSCLKGFIGALFTSPLFCTPQSKRFTAILSLLVSSCRHTCCHLFFLCRLGCGTGRASFPPQPPSLSVPPCSRGDGSASRLPGWRAPLLRSQDMAFGSIPPLQTAAATFLPKARESLRESYCERQWGVLFSLHMTPVCLFLVYYCKTLELDSRIEV